MKINSPAHVSGASRCIDLLYFLLAILLLPYFFYRRLRGKKSAPWSARMAHLPQRSTERQRFWIHAVSVGEANAAAPLLKALNAAFPDADTVISTTTLTGFAVAQKKYGADRVLQYPHDFSWVVRRFLDRVRPSVVILMELEVWPNMTAEARARGIPIVVLNARITARSAQRYKLGWLMIGIYFSLLWWLLKRSRKRPGLLAFVFPYIVTSLGYASQDFNLIMADVTLASILLLATVRFTPGIKHHAPGTQ